MAQFGLKMDFLWFIQVLGFIFILKIQFLIHLIDLKQFWIGPQLLVSSGANPQDLQDTARHWSGLRVDFQRGEGLFRKVDPRRGTGRSRPLDPEPRVRIKSSQRRTGMRQDPPDLRSTDHGAPTPDRFCALRSYIHGSRLAEPRFLIWIADTPSYG